MHPEWGAWPLVTVLPGSLLLSSDLGGSDLGLGATHTGTPAPPTPPSRFLTRGHLHAIGPPCGVLHLPSVQGSLSWGSHLPPAGPRTEGCGGAHALSESYFSRLALSRSEERLPACPHLL